MVPPVNITGTQVRAWAQHHGHPVPENQPLPDQLREKYRQARLFVIRRSYARKKNRVN